MEAEVNEGSASVETTSLKVCRVCLATECKLYPLELTMYRQLLGDHYMPAGRGGRQCGTCARRLTLCAQLRERAIHAQRVLGEYGPLTIEKLKSAGISQNILNTLSTKHYDVNHADLEINYDMKIEIFETETRRNESIVLFLDENTYDDNQLSDSSDVKVKNERTTDRNHSNTDKENLDDRYEDNSSCDIPIIELKEAQLKQKVKSKTSLNVKTSKARKGKTDVKIDRRRKPFGSEMSFTVTDMTAEEQLEMIRKRQETDNFKVSPYKCMICFKGFVDDDAYKAHMSRHTNESGDHECKVCRIHFKTSNALRKHHTAYHSQRFDCTLCGYTTVQRSSARLHEKWHKGTVYTCPHCADTFNKLTTYMGHVRIKHPSRYVCQLCGFSFVSDKGILMHKKLKHRLEDTTVPVDGPQCSECGVRFCSESALRTHRSVAATCLQRNTPRAKSTKKQVEQSQKRDDNSVGVRQRRNSRSRKTDGCVSSEEVQVEGSFKHEDLDKLQVSSKRELIKRNTPSKAMKMKRTKMAAAAKNWRLQKQEQITCEKCGIKLTSGREYQRHFLSQHPTEKMPTSANPCLCFICGRLFRTPTVLQDHMTEHAEHCELYKCDTCGKGYRKKAALYRHNSLHLGKRYPCPICGKQFNQVNNRDRHYTYVHSSVKDVKCDFCEKLFKNKGDQKLHVTHVHLKKPYPKRDRSRKRQIEAPAAKRKRDVNVLETEVPSWTRDGELSDGSMDN